MLESLKSRIADFEQKPFDNEEITSKFIEYLYLVEIGEDEIYSFFEEYNNIDDFYTRKSDFKHFKKYHQYYRIFFWQACLRIAVYSFIDIFLDNCERLDTGKIIKTTLEVIKTPLEEMDFHKESLRKKENKFIHEVAKYILRKEEDLLVKDIGRYLQEKIQDYKKQYDSKEEIIQYNYKDIVEFISFYDILKKDIENEFYSELYPIGLFEKIKSLIPTDFLEYFEDEKKKEKEKIEELQQKINSNIEFDGNLKKKDFYDKWEILVNSDERDLYLQYADLITEWNEHFPIKLLRKEIEKANKECIAGVLHSENEYAVRALFAYIKKHNIIIPCAKEMPLGEISTNINYYKLLIKFFANSEDVAGYILRGYSESEKTTTFVRALGFDLFFSQLNAPNFIDSTVASFLDLHNRLLSRYLLDISNIIDGNIAIWEKIKKFSEVNIDSAAGQILYDPFRKLTFEEYNEMEKSVEVACWEKESFFSPISKEEYAFEQKKYENIDINKTTVPIWQINLNERQYSRTKFWLYGHEELNLQDLKLDNGAYKKLRNITLEKPFFFPEYKSKKTDNIMESYLYRELSFPDFCQQELYKHLKNEILWKLYFQKFIEDTYKAFKQPNFQKPLLPIIPEYAEYLLSRTDDMFSTAIEGIIHNEFEVFLTESRKLQIKTCLKNKIIQEEESENLMKLAESYEANYYAWSDEEIKKCLLPGTDLEKLNAILEPEFMVRIFEKSILWVIEHKDSELWQNAPWFGMQIFNKSYADRPSIWAKHLIKIADEWNGSENILRRICIALGHLREPLGDKVPKKLKEMAGNPQNERIRKDILVQYSLFSHENFKKMHHEGNELKRVELCKRELIISQNNEVKERAQKNIIQEVTF